MNMVILIANKIYLPEYRTTMVMVSQNTNEIYLLKYPAIAVVINQTKYITITTNNLVIN